MLVKQPKLVSDVVKPILDEPNFGQDYDVEFLLQTHEHLGKASRLLSRRIYAELNGNPPNPGKPAPAAGGAGTAPSHGTGG